MNIPWIEPNQPLPCPSKALADPNGLLAAGGNLLPDYLFKAYQAGVFPWYQDPPILWWSPNPRAIIVADSLHISRTMRPLAKQLKLRNLPNHCLRITTDTAFTKVINLCKSIHAQGNGAGWITHAMQSAYIELHLRGHAHSFELWLGDELIAGIYGVHSRRIFSAESMFGLYDNASKLLLIRCCQHLFNSGFSALDCQIANSHTDSLGAKSVPREDYLTLLDCSAIPFTPLFVE